MIQKPVLDIGVQFQSKWSPLLRNCPFYVLDQSYAAAGIIDQILFWSALSGDTSVFQDDLQGAAACLGGIAHDIWVLFEGNPAAELSFSDDQEIVLIAKGGKHLQDTGEARVNLSQAIAAIYSDPHAPVPVFDNFNRPLEAGHNRIGPFAAGLIAGRSPLIEGRWNRVPLENFKENLATAKLCAAESTADYYARLFPGEEMGHSAELYMTDLILPPAMWDEPYPALRAATTALEHMLDLEQRASGNGIRGDFSDRLKRLAVNLARLPDELASSTGMALLCALADSVEPQTLAVLRGSETYLPQLRAAVVFSRKLLGRPHDWFKLLEEKQHEVARRLFEIDSALGLLPLARLDSKILAKPHFMPLLAMLAWSKTEDAIKACAYIDTNFPGEESAALRLQEAFLQLASNELDAATLAIKGIEPLLASCSELEKQIFCEVAGTLQLRIGNAAEAEKIFKRALALKGLLFSAEKCATGLLRALLAQEKHDEAAKAGGIIVAQFPWSVSARASYFEALYALERFEPAAETVRYLVSTAPTSREAFACNMAAKAFAA